MAVPVAEGYGDELCPAFYVPSFKEIGILLDDGIQHGDLEDECETIVPKIWSFMERWSWTMIYIDGGHRLLVYLIKLHSIIRLGLR